MADYLKGLGVQTKARGFGDQATAYAGPKVEAGRILIKQKFTPQSESNNVDSRVITGSKPFMYVINILLILWFGALVYKEYLHYQEFEKSSNDVLKNAAVVFGILDVVALVYLFYLLYKIWDADIKSGGFQFNVFGFKN